MYFLSRRPSIATMKQSEHRTRLEPGSHFHHKPLGVGALMQHRSDSNLLHIIGIKTPSGSYSG